ncbi:MAG: hypothetical protein GY764_01420, partial [Halieaceae bacterium]|nr:hypothetical protein [Halieaceae bacterium]
GEVATNQGLVFGFRNDNFTCAVWGADLNVQIANDESNCHQLAFTYDAGTTTRTIYRDGVQIAQDSASGNYTGLGATYIGRIFNGEWPFKGTIDEVGIWTESLTAGDIAVLYSKVKAQDESIIHALLPNASPGATSGATSLDLENLELRETATQLGTVFGSTSRTLTIDTDNPVICPNNTDGSKSCPPADQYVNAASTLAISGLAADPTSFIETVEVDVGGWSSSGVEGTESWSYNWDISALGEGKKTLPVRATDAVGHVSGTENVTVIVDRTPPSTTFDPINGVQQPRQALDGHWMVSLSGKVNEPNAGGKAGSGLVSVELLFTGDGDLAGQQWQEATLSGSNWSIDYILPAFGESGQSMADPSGDYTVSLRATDQVGNTTTPANYITETLSVDSTAPALSLTYPVSTTSVISTTLTLTGKASDDHAAVGSVQVNFTPAEQLDALTGTALHLPFDENQFTEYFVDQSGSGHAAVCSGAQCPTFGQSGQRDRAVALDGTDDYLIAPFLFDPSRTEFSAAIWFNAGNVDSSFMALIEQVPGYAFLGLLNGNVLFAAPSGYTLSSEPVIQANQWYHSALTHDGVTLRLYLNGELVDSVDDTPNASTAAVHIGVDGDGSDGFFNGLLDEVTMYDRVLAGYEVANLYAYGSGTWADASLDGSSWTYTIPEGDNGLEGIYQINLRSKDTLGNVTALGHQRQWRGEIDTRPPAVTYSAAPSTNGGTTTTSYNCTATDYNLVEGSSCLPVAPATLPQFRNSDMTMTTYDQVDAWYSATISDTTRLYNMDATRTYTGTQDTTGSVTTCDKYNRCTTVAPAVKLDAVDTTPTLATEVLDPSSGTVLTTLDPVTVEGFAYAEAYLKELLVTINNTPAYDHSWEWGTETENQWLFDWTPPAEGIYNFMPRVTDWHGEGPPPMPLTTYMPLVFAADPLAGEAADTDVSQTTSATTDSSGATSPSTTHTGNVTTLYVDTEPPAITIDPLLLNANDLIGGRTVYVTGTASDTVRVHRVEVSINSGPWQRAGLAADGHWHYPWFLHQEVDGEIFDIRARATDLAGRTTTATEDVVVDIAAPEHDQITLSYVNTDGQTHDVSPGSTLRDAVALQVSWTAGSDGHGIASYEASFSNDRTPPPPGPPHFIPYPGPDTHEQDPAGEAQTWYAHVSIIDIAGNNRTETVGPIHVDAPLTPDLVGNLRYRGWTDAECTIQGVDRRLAQRHPGVFGNEIQSMFASWDENALRLSWNGAHWQHHGDLFFYLDTHIGGAQQLFNPYPDDNTIIYLPGNTPQTPTNGGMRQLAALESVTTQQAMRADFMVWVEDEKQATFWRWNGSSWQNEGTLDEESFRLSADIEASDTDILLPFEKLGILDPSTATLGLLAVASEEDSLELWATMPDRNPLNSARLLDGFADQDEETTLALSRAYYWEGLGNGHCANGRLNSDGSGPAGGAYADSDLQMTLSASPVGTIYHFMGEGLSPWWTLLFGYENVPYVPSLLLDHRDTNHPPLGPGETISYTINYVNHGSEAATGVQLDLQSWLSLELPNHVVDLGDIPPGGSGSYTFSGAVDVSGQGQVAYNECRLNFPPQICDRTKEWAALDVYVYDDQSPRDPVAGPWSSAPLEWLWSDHPVDSSPPSAVGISSPTSVIPAGEVTIRGFAHDQSAVPLITLQARVGGTVSSIDCPQGATTQNGNWTCNWDPGAVTDGEIVDLQVRATDEFGHTSEWSAWISLTVDSSPPTITVNPGVDGETLGAGTHALSGMLSNSQSGGEVRLCVEDELPCQIVPVDPQTGRWSTHLPSPDAGAPDALSVTLKLYGADAAGNSTVDPVTISYLLDTVHPELEVTTVVEEVDENTSGPVLAGSASDGSAFDVYVELRPPSGSNERYQAGVTDGEWSFNHTFSEIGTYRAWVQAVDIAGNRRTNGPFLITVTSP